MHLGEEERRIYVSLANQERLAAQEDAHAAKVRPFLCRSANSMASLPAAMVVSRRARLAHAGVVLHDKNQHLAMVARDSATCDAMHGTACLRAGLPALKLI